MALSIPHFAITLREALRKSHLALIRHLFGLCCTVTFYITFFLILSWYLLTRLTLQTSDSVKRLRAALIPFCLHFCGIQFSSWHGWENNVKVGVLMSKARPTRILESRVGDPVHTTDFGPRHPNDSGYTGPWVWNVDMEESHTVGERSGKDRRGLKLAGLTWLGRQCEDTFLSACAWPPNPSYISLLTCLPTLLISP